MALPRKIFDRKVPVKLRALRAVLGLTQRQAAQRAGVTYSVWRNWELGRNNPSAFAVRILHEVFPELEKIRLPEKKPETPLDTAASGS